MDSMSQPIIRNLPDVLVEIKDYLALRIEEIEADFETDEVEEDMDI